MRALGSEGSCPRFECRLGFLTRGKGFLAASHLLSYGKSRVKLNARGPAKRHAAGGERSIKVAADEET
ncbi:hypothetical protein E2C01_079106 [Portunus trituberculatus]|uniref:Uncharacterized protein n=1 Tax=Portunus trituberculatus TaxID=210409 RepID=A0A5B7IUP2_PORTR|nr:hypothetical protein [Portunus trituberculatus]